MLSPVRSLYAKRTTLRFFPYHNDGISINTMKLDYDSSSGAEEDRNNEPDMPKRRFDFDEDFGCYALSRCHMIRDG